MTGQLAPRNPDFVKAVREQFSRDALMGTLGAWLVEVEAGRVVVELPYAARVAQAEGIFHGAVVGMLAQVCGIYAALTLVAADNSIAAIGFKIDGLEPARGTLLRVEARVESISGGTTVVRAEVACRQGKAAKRCGLLTGTLVAVEP